MDAKEVLDCLMQIKRERPITERRARELIIQRLVVKKDEFLFLTESARRFLRAWFNSQRATGGNK